MSRTAIVAASNLPQSRKNEFHRQLCHDPKTADRHYTHINTVTRAVVAHQSYQQALAEGTNELIMNNNNYL